MYRVFTRHFANQIHGRIYDAIHRLVDRGQIADPITLRDFFDKDKILEPIGGAHYLIDLTSFVISIINVIVMIGCTCSRLFFLLYTKVINPQLVEDDEHTPLVREKENISSNDK